QRAYSAIRSISFSDRSALPFDSTHVLSAGPELAWSYRIGNFASPRVESFFDPSLVAMFISTNAALATWSSREARSPGHPNRRIQHSVRFLVVVVQFLIVLLRPSTRPRAPAV